MDIQKLISEKDKQFKTENKISFSHEELRALTQEEIKHLIDYFHGYVLVRLPEREIRFFEWLKINDENVWDDLWGTDEDLYLVSIDLLRHLAGATSVFPICDLVDEPNFWFCEKHIKPKGMEALNHIALKVDSGRSLDFQDQFLLQLAEEPQDLWHFCHNFQISIAEMKKNIEEMVYKGWIVHLPDRADLVKYIEI